MKSPKVAAWLLLRLAAAVLTLTALLPFSAVSAGVDDRLFASSFERPAAIDLTTTIPSDGQRLSAQFVSTIAVGVVYEGAARPGLASLVVDGVDVSAQAQLTNSLLSYAVPTPLAVGVHRVEARVGAARASWSFEIVPAPTVVAFSPHGTTLASPARPRIEATLRDAASDLVRESLSLRVDGAVVDAATTLASAREATLHFTPATALAPGEHHAEVRAKNAAGGYTQGFALFFVDAAPAYTVAFLAPSAGAVVTRRDLPVAVTAGATQTSLSRIEVNGVVLRETGLSDGGPEFGAVVPLIPGDNTLVATATYADGAVRTATAHVTYDAPPSIVITGPADFSTFGRVESNGAPVPGGAIDLTGSVQRPVRITGTTTLPVESVSVNQQQALLAADRRSFTFNNFFLHEGTNLVSANATDARGRVATAQITVFVDQTAPLLSVEGPADGAVTSAAAVDVRGIANDAVEAGLNAPEPTVRVDNAANGERTTATVHDRYYLVRDVPLAVGVNTLTVVATDALGNARNRTLRVTRVAAGSQRVTRLAGDRQGAPVLTRLPQPLVVAAIDRDGLPLANLPIRFDVLRGSGTIARSADGADTPDGVAAARNLVVATDASGRAQVWLTLGNEAGEAANMVRAWSESLAEDALFTATGQRGPVAQVFVNGLSGSQFVSTDSQPVEALSAVVLDAQRNALAGTPLRFSVVAGDAHFAPGAAPGAIIAQGEQSIIVPADKNGVASVRPTTGSTPGVVQVRAEALVDGVPRGAARFQLSVLERRDAPTAFTGVVLDHTGAPLGGVRLAIDRTSLSAVSGADGRFVFDDNVPPGKISLHVDGTRVAAPRAGAVVEYPGLHFETAVVQGQRNQLPHPIYLPPVDRALGVRVGGAQDVRATIPGYDGFEMIVKARSVTFPDGSTEGDIVVTPVHGDRLPMVPPGGYASFGALAWTIQPTGTRFDPPIEVHLPNTTGLRRGETLPIVQWDHDLATFVPMGRGTVTEDGTRLVSDPGTGLTKAGWGGGPPPPPPNDGTDDDCPAGKRREECECQVSEVTGQCIATIGQAVSYAAVSPTPDELDWKGGQGASPPQGSGGSYPVTFGELPNKFTYASDVQALCRAEPGRQAKKELMAGKECSAYEPMATTYVRNDAAIGDGADEGTVWGQTRHSHYPLGVRGCVAAGPRWAHRVPKLDFVYGIQLVTPTGAHKPITGADSPNITSRNCRRVLRDLTPSVSAFGTQTAPYSEYVPTAVVEMHEQFHVQDAKTRAVDPAASDLATLIDNLPTTECGVENPYEKVRDDFKDKWRTRLGEYKEGRGHETRAYNDEMNNLAALRNAIRERAKLEGWDKDCQPPVPEQ
jgi:hypothetical protein